MRDVLGFHVEPGLNLHVAEPERPVWLGRLYACMLILLILVSLYLRLMDWTEKFAYLCGAFQRVMEIRINYISLWQ